MIATGSLLMTKEEWLKEEIQIYSEKIVCRSPGLELRIQVLCDFRQREVGDLLVEHGREGYLLCILPGKLGVVIRLFSDLSAGRTYCGYFWTDRIWSISRVDTESAVDKFSLYKL